MTRDPDYLWDGSGDDPEVAALEQQLGAFAHNAPLRPPPPGPNRRRTVIVAASVVMVAAAVIIAVVLVRRDGGQPGSTWVATGGDGGPGPAGFAYDVQGGAALCDGKPTEAGILRVGGWLETEAGATAAVQVADIGDIQLKPGSRLRLVGTGPDQHRLELARGKLSARVLAPPRLFIIDTPTAAAVDLGCAYDLEVDDDGRTHLRVTSGAVSLEGHGRVAWVPWAHEVVSVPGRGPGTPFMIAAPPSMREALAAFDGGDAAAIVTIVSMATDRDLVTLWNLLARTDGADRAAVFTRLDALAIRPEWVLEEDVLSAQPQALEDWRQSLEGTWNVGP